MRPYVSLDLETTGVDTERSDILEIGFVYDDGVSEGHKLLQFNFILDLKSINYAEFGALKMNARLLDAIHKKENVAPISMALNALLYVVNAASADAMLYDEKHGRKPNPRISIAGKNVASFDLPILRNFIRRQNDGNLNLTMQMIESRLQHRALDVGSMYAADFGYVPNLTEIKSLQMGKPTVSHIAVEDAMDVVVAVRHKAWAVNHDKS